MRVEKFVIVSLGYGKYFRSDRIVGLEPIEQGRGPGKRTFVYVEGIDDPIVASRSENAILRDMVETPRAVTRLREQYQLLGDILDSMQSVDPMLRDIIRAQGHWDLDRLTERIQAVLTESEED